MRRAAAIVASAFVAALSACSLLTSLDGFSDGDAATDAAGDTATNPADGSSGADGTVGIDGGDAGDAGPSRSALYAAAVLADNPVGYWRLEETTGDVAKDESGNHDGKYVELPMLAQPGVAGSRAMKIPGGQSAHMRVATSAYAFGANAAHTIEVWAKPGTFSAYQWLATTENAVAGGRNGWSVLTDGDGRVLYEVWLADGDGGSRVTRGASSQALTAGAFAHVVVVYDGNNAPAGFVDGIPFGGFGIDAVVPNTAELVWGCAHDSRGCLDGWVIDELAIYAGALTEARVKAHYELGK